MCAGYACRLAVLKYSCQNLYISLSLTPDQHSYIKQPGRWSYVVEHTDSYSSSEQVVVNLAAISCLKALQIHNVPGHKAISHAATRWNEAAWYTKSVSMATMLRKLVHSRGALGAGLLAVIMHNHGGHISQTWPASLINSWKDAAACEEMLCSLWVLLTLENLYSKLQQWLSFWTLKFTWTDFIQKCSFLSSMCFPNRTSLLLNLSTCHGAP